MALSCQGVAGRSDDIGAVRVAVRERYLGNLAERRAADARNRWTLEDRAGMEDSETYVRNLRESPAETAGIQVSVLIDSDMSLKSCAADQAIVRNGPHWQVRLRQS